MSYYDNFDDQEKMPGDEEERPEIPEGISPDDPDYEFYKSLSQGQVPPNFMQGAFKMVPDGKGGFKHVPLTPKEMEFFKAMFTSQPVSSSGNNRTYSFHPQPTQINFPHFYIFNSEYILQIVNGVANEGPDVTLYIEIIKNPAIKEFKYSILDVYEKTKGNQFINFIISVYAELYLWDVSGLKVNIVQNAHPKTPDEKIVIIAKCSKNIPDWVAGLNPIDFIGYEITKTITPFKDTPAQLFENIYVKKHVYEPILRVDASLAIGSNYNILLTDENIDMYGIYHNLVMPAIVDALDVLYPEIALTSLYSRQTLECAHIAFETKLTDYMLEVIFYIAPAYIVAQENKVFEFMPLGDNIFAIGDTPVSHLPFTDREGLGVCGNAMKMVNHMYSSQDSQTMHMSLRPLGKTDIYNASFSVSDNYAILFLFSRLPSEQLMKYWGTGKIDRLFNCDMYESKSCFVTRIIAPDEEAIVPKNPESTSINDGHMMIMGFVEFDVLTTTSLGIDTYGEGILAIKDELIEYLHMKEEDFENLMTDPKFCMTEVWAGGSIVRLCLCKAAPLVELSEHAAELKKKIDKINNGGQPKDPAPSATTPHRKQFPWKKT